MHEFIARPEDVIALKLSGKITNQDLDAFMDRLEAALARPGKVHIFAETQGIDGIDVAALPSHTARAMPLLGKLDRFGRIAIVADQAWVRVGTRIESMLLPTISYEVFEPDRRDEALDWAFGKSERPQ